MSSSYLTSQTSKEINNFFRKNFHYEAEIKLNWLPKNVTLFHDIFPLGYQSAHLLLWSKENAISFFKTTLQQKKDIIEANGLLLHNLHKLYPTHNIIFFEHGPGYINKCLIGCGGCHVNHAHIHLVVLPTKTPQHEAYQIINTALIGNGWDNPISSRREINEFEKINLITQNYPYLLVGWYSISENIQIYVYMQTNNKYNLESQLMRKVIGSISGHPEPGYWHWKDFMLGLASPKRINQLRKDIPIFRRKLGSISRP